jgi:hypothetical protein
MSDFVHFVLYNADFPGIVAFATVADAAVDDILRSEQHREEQQEQYQHHLGQHQQQQNYLGPKQQQQQQQEKNGCNGEDDDGMGTHVNMEQSEEECFLLLDKENSSAISIAGITR